MGSVFVILWRLQHFKKIWHVRQDSEAWFVGQRGHVGEEFFCSTATFFSISIGKAHRHLVIIKIKIAELFLVQWSHLRGPKKWYK